MIRGLSDQQNQQNLQNQQNKQIQQNQQNQQIVIGATYISDVVFNHIVRLKKSMIEMFGVLTILQCHFEIMLMMLTI